MLEQELIITGFWCKQGQKECFFGGEKKEEFNQIPKKKSEKQTLQLL